jgi:lactate racemase
MCSARTIELYRSAWYGERASELAVPEAWDVEILGGDTLPALSTEALREAVRKPLAGPTLAELARNAKTAAIVIDDITRPTPTAEILPILLDELGRAGIARSEVTVFVAGGTHGVASEDDIERKVGPGLRGVVRVVAHDMRVSELRDLGRSSRGTPIRANAQLLDCDLKLGIGGLYPHPAAGFSGGSKLIAPGLCGVETARFLHDNLAADDCRGREDTNTFRADIGEIAARIGLAFVVNIALNFERRVAAAFAGDPAVVQREGVAFVRRVYSVPVATDADVVISDAYPFDTDFHFAADRATWPLAARPAGTGGVLLAACPLGPGGHEFDLPLGRRIVNRLRSVRPQELRRLPQRFRNLRGLLARKRLEFVLVSEQLAESQLKDAYPRASVQRTWDDALNTLTRTVRTASPRVAVYRCAPLLVPGATGEHRSAGNS